MSIASTKLPELHNSADWLLLLDVDGTLLDIAPTPSKVVVHPDLRKTLLDLYERLAGAVVLVSGRDIIALDQIFMPLRLPMIGSHGGEWRLNPLQARVHCPHASLPKEIRRQVNLLIQEHPELLLEQKSISLAVHYRRCPHLQEKVHAFLHDVVAAHEKHYELLINQLTAEILPRGLNKREAVEKIIARPQFSGRTPVYIGDGSIDIDAINWVQNSTAGYGIWVGNAPLPQTPWQARTAAEVRQWLRAVAEYIASAPVARAVQQPLHQRHQTKGALTLSSPQRLVTVSNRVVLPRSHKANAGGLAVAVDELLQQRGGVWFGWDGKITSDQTPAVQQHRVDPVTYITTDLSAEEHTEYYNGFCNSILWPLLSQQLNQAQISSAHFDAYCTTNRRFAAALKAHVKPSDIIWVHDYHLIPLGQYLRENGINNRMGFFLHTPFPASELMATLPVHQELLTTLYAYDVIGVQTNRDLQALQGYLASHQITLKAQALFPERTLDAVHINAFPISIPTTETMRLGMRAVTHTETTRLKESLDGRKLMIGVDRLDYSKALPARLKAIDAMLEQCPELIRTFTYLQISPPSRAGVYGYDELRQAVEALVGHINGKYATFDWTPIRFLAQGLRRETLMGFYRSADVCLVTPYRDGMNLVAKEYIAAQDAQSPGVLVLSEFAGAAEELQEAVLVNPYDIPAMAASFHTALTMPDAERKTRWRRMMLQLKQHDLKAWQDKFLDALTGGL